MPPAPLAGHRNCSRCTRWRPVIDFPVGRTHRRDGTPLDPPQLSAWCESCRRAAARRRAYERYHRLKARKRRALMRARKRVESGEAVWAEPLRKWVGKQRAAGREWTQLAEWAGCDEANLRRAVHPDALTVSIDVADRLLTRAGVGLELLYPWDEPHADAPAELAAA